VPSSYYTSDVHLRLDQPERAHRFARWVQGLESDARLTIVGDLCDFWFASRQHRIQCAECPGLQALADFRLRGGALTILPGNHDSWLGPFYQRTLGVPLSAEPLMIEEHGLSIRLLHGHRLGGQPIWKGWMESRAFLTAFRALPNPLATCFDRVRVARNEKEKERENARQLQTFETYARAAPKSINLLILAHIHRSYDNSGLSPRLIIPGGWFGQSAFVRIDASGANLIVEKDSCHSKSTS